VIRTIDALKTFDTDLRDHRRRPRNGIGNHQPLPLSAGVRFLQHRHGIAVVVVFFVIVLALALLLLHVREKTKWT
jgi:multiple sugar transport system permease protein